MNSPTIRIVIATYKRPDDLRKCLDSIVPQVRGRPNVRLVVINDGTHDSAYARTVEPFANAIDYRPNPENLGHGPIRQIACQDAEEDYLVFTDDDCVAKPGWFAWLEAMIETYPEVDMFCGRTEPVRSDNPHYIEKFLCNINAFPGPIVTARGLRVAVTANFAVKRKAFVAAGGFDPKFTTASEDWNLTFRLLNAGATYRLCWDWVIGHKADQSFREVYRRYYGYGFGGANHILYARDWRAAPKKRLESSHRLIFDQIRKRTAWLKKDGALADLSFVEKYLCLVLTIMIGVQYARGWNAGYKHFSRKYGVKFPADYKYRAPLADSVANPVPPDTPNLPASIQSGA